MIVKELVEVLKEMPQDAILNFQIGDNKEYRNILAKAQLLEGESMYMMDVYEVQFCAHFEQGEDEPTRLVEVYVKESNCFGETLVKFAKEYDEKIKLR